MDRNERLEQILQQQAHEQIEKVAIGLLLIAITQRLGIDQEPDIALMIKVIDGGTPADDEALAQRCAQAATLGIPGSRPKAG